MNGSLRTFLAVAVVSGAAAHGKPAAPATRPTTRPATRPATQPATRPAVRPSLGIRFTNERDTEEGARQVAAFGSNMLVQEVLPGSRAERMGFHPGDVILRINGKKMMVEQDVIGSIRKAATLKVDVLRDGKPVTLDESNPPPPDRGGKP